MPNQLELRDDDGCFVCGRANPLGLKLDFSEEDGEYVTYFTPGKQHQGYVNITHGGIISTLLDEVMARYVHILGYHAVTGEITVRLRKPARTDVQLRVVGRIDTEDRRIIHTSAKATDPEGQLIAEATAKMVKVA